MNNPNSPSGSDLKSQLPPDWRELSYKERRTRVRQGQYPVPNWEPLSKPEQIRLLRAGIERKGRGK